MQNTIQSHEDLFVWRRAVELSVLVYKLTDTFPRREIYGISSQMRRAAVSIPSNIAEGRRRGTTKDFTQFLRIAHGSVAELETQLLISQRLAFWSGDSGKQISSIITEVSKMLHAIIKKLGQ